MQFELKINVMQMGAKLLKICSHYGVEKRILKRHRFEKNTFSFLFI
jgi:hypothetical protein